MIKLIPPLRLVCCSENRRIIELQESQGLSMPQKHSMLTNTKQEVVQTQLPVMLSPGKAISQAWVIWVILQHSICNKSVARLNLPNTRQKVVERQHDHCTTTNITGGPTRGLQLYSVAQDLLQR